MMRALKEDQQSSRSAVRRMPSLLIWSRLQTVKSWTLFCARYSITKKRSSLGLLLAVTLRCWRSILKIWGFTKRLASFLTFRLSTTLWPASKDRLVLLKLPKSTLGKRSARRNGWATGRTGRYDKPRHTTRLLMHMSWLKFSMLLCRNLAKRKTFTWANSC